MESYYSSDEEIAWGPITLREIKGDLKRPARKLSRRITLAPNFKMESSKCSHNADINIPALTSDDMSHLSEEVTRKLNISPTPTDYYTPNESLQTESNSDFLERLSKVINEPQSCLPSYASTLDTKACVLSHDCEASIISSEAVNSSYYTAKNNITNMDDSYLNFMKIVPEQITGYDIANFEQTLIKSPLLDVLKDEKMSIIEEDSLNNECVNFEISQTREKYMDSLILISDDEEYEDDMRTHERSEIKFNFADYVKEEEKQRILEEQPIESLFTTKFSTKKLQDGGKSCGTNYEECKREIDRNEKSVDANVPSSFNDYAEEKQRILEEPIESLFTTKFSTKKLQDGDKSCGTNYEECKHEIDRNEKSVDANVQSSFNDYAEEKQRILEEPIESLFTPKFSTKELQDGGRNCGTNYEECKREIERNEKSVHANVPFNFIDYAKEEDQRILEEEPIESLFLPKFSSKEFQDGGKNCEIKYMEKRDTSHYNLMFPETTELASEKVAAEEERVISDITGFPTQNSCINTSPISLPEIDLAQFDDSTSKSNSPKLNDTMEEMDRLLHKGLDYTLSDDDSIIERTPLKTDTREVKKFTASSILPSLAFSTHIPVPASNSNQKRPNRFDIKRTPDSNFKIPEKPFRPKLTNPTPPKLFSNNLKNVISPVALYIKNSPCTPLKQKVPRRDLLKIVPTAKTPKNSMKENFPTLPEVVYQPSKKQIVSSKKDVVIPLSIKRLNVKEPTVTKHEGRIQQTIDRSVVRKMLLQPDITDTSINSSSLSDSKDISVLTCKQAFIK